VAKHEGGILAAIFFTLPAVAMAQTAAPPATNFPAIRDYPGPACAKPGAPPKRPSVINAMEVDRYNALLGTYNKKAHDYVVCINAYVRAADNDSDLIRRKSRDAVDEANGQNQ
jgi:hypothetical protein